MNGLACVVLAAGQGTRMKSRTPKILHPILGRPMLGYCLDTLSALGPSRTIIIVRDGHADVEVAFRDRPGVSLVTQGPEEGTAGALRSAMPALVGGASDGTVLVTCGDTPLITPGTLKAFLGRHLDESAQVSVLSFRAEDPGAYGRIVRNPDGAARGIVEKKDATEAELAIDEVNSGVYAIEAGALAHLAEIGPNPITNEYYLTDLVALALGAGRRVSVHCLGEEAEFMGINDRAQLAEAQGIMMRRINRGLMLSGVTLVDPETAYISPEAAIGPDSVIYPNVHIEGATRIGTGCVIHQGSRIVDSALEDGVTVRDWTLIDASEMREGSVAGPFAHLRMHTVLGRDARVGNFVEIKRSEIGEGVKCMHLSYLGDATVGSRSNIGAGTITCNYDGLNKHRTDIGEGAFIGSDTQLVAPVKVGPGAYVGAGSTVTRDVPGGALSLSRTPQRTIEGWAEKKKSKTRQEGR